MFASGSSGFAVHRSEVQCTVVEETVYRPANARCQAFSNSLSPNAVKIRGDPRDALTEFENSVYVATKQKHSARLRGVTRIIRGL